MLRKVLLAGALLLLLAGCGAHKFIGTEFPGAPAAAEILLTAHTGEPFRLSDSKGRLTLLFFGYSNCPDICPAMLGVAQQTLERLGQDAGRVQVLFVTTDPERDTPAALAQYVARFHVNIIGLTGSEDALKGVAAAYGVMSEVETHKHGDASALYEVGHTSRLYLIDASGALRLSYLAGVSAGDLLADIQYLLST